MADYTGTVLGTNKLGLVGALQVVRARFSFSAITLGDDDTFIIADLFTQNGAVVPVEVEDFTLVSSTTTPASLVAIVGNSENPNGFLRSAGLTETGQLVRKGNGALIGTRINNGTVLMDVTTSAGAAYTGDLDFIFAVRRCID